jgi:hypothetical protein
LVSCVSIQRCLSARQSRDSRVLEGFPVVLANALAGRD